MIRDPTLLIRSGTSGGPRKEPSYDSTGERIRHIGTVRNPNPNRNR